MKVIKSTIWVVFISMLFADALFAKRVAPAQVKAVQKDGISYKKVATRVVATDMKSGVQIWDRQIYVIKYNVMLERDIQDVHITSLKIDADDMIIKNEKGYEYKLDLKTLTVVPLKGTILIDKTK